MVVKAITTSQLTTRAAIYIRVSTDEQANEGFSIEAQKRRLLAYAASQDWDVSEVYIDDGWSAKDLKRPEMQRMMLDAQNRLFEVVLVYKLDRMTRSSIDCDHLLKLFESNGVKFQSCTESFETRTATGRLFIRLVADIAQWERENTAERVRMGMEQMVTEGRRPGGPVPFGYEKDAVTIIPEEASILRLLRSYYIAGDGLKVIAIKLNEMGLLRRGNKWGAFTVWYALDNPYYAGKIRYGAKKPNGKYQSRKKEGVDDFILADSNQHKIFTWEEYEEHRALMISRSFGVNTKNRDYWFAGVLLCGKCGGKMCGQCHQNKRNDGSYNKVTSYICSNRQDGKGCKMPMFRQELVENLFLEWIDNINLDQNQLDEVAATIEISSSEEERGLLNRELVKVKERRKKWQRMYADDLIEEEELRTHNADEREKEQTILDQLSKLPNPKQFSTTEPNKLVFEIPDVWPLLDDKDKKDLVQELFQEIVVFSPIENAKGRRGKFIPANIQSVKFN